jgi:hypothetical protein
VRKAEKSKGGEGQRENSHISSGYGSKGGERKGGEEKARGGTAKRAGRIKAERGGA